MDVLSRGLGAAALLAMLSGCQVGYYLKSAKSQVSLLLHRVPIEEALKDPRLNDEQKEKLRRAEEAHAYAGDAMGLRRTRSYTSFVLLDRPAVSYVVSAAPKWKLEHYEWAYPIVGKMPYRGYADENDAKEEQASLEKEQDLDTFLRGVSAYSTLGWFNDPILSSMLRLSEHDLVNTVLHETTHATLYIHNSADFNERLAVFVGNQGTEEFYKKREGPNSPTVRKIREENEDDRAFSAFIGPRIQALRAWYESLPADQHREELRQAKFKEIQSEFSVALAPKLKTTSYRKFPETKLNNARLLYYKMYMQDLSDFQALYDRVDHAWPKFIACAKTLEKAEKPETALKELTARVGKEGFDVVCGANLSPAGKASFFD